MLEKYFLNFVSFIVLHIFFCKLKVCDGICCAHKFDHILNKCRRFFIGFVIHTKGSLPPVSVLPLPESPFSPSSPPFTSVPSSLCLLFYFTCRLIKSTIKSHFF